MIDPDAFGAWYAQEAEAVLMFHVRRTVDVHVAAELTAETFAQAWRSRASMKAETDVERRAWLFTIARRTLGRWRRRGRLERRAIEALGIRVPVVHEDDLAAIERRADLGTLRGRVGEELGGSVRRLALRCGFGSSRSAPTRSFLSSLGSASRPPVPGSRVDCGPWRPRWKVIARCLGRRR